MLCGCVHDWCRPFSPELAMIVRLRARLLQAILTRASDAVRLRARLVQAMLTGSDAVRLRARLVQAILTRAMLCGCVHDWCRPCSPELRDAVRLRARLVQAMLTRA
ncbi:hypothetical protein NDU88_000116 [Pleurodeles waltl]|uniref:Uncharacterized protein n=1 Tax=Pleurodeles waltl TaxID=8319 RepID=A0AAV7LVI1_PLEWA|nr:hypothetical protein NDU88_000116 [Pleurodeles waltl]